MRLGFEGIGLFGARIALRLKPCSALGSFFVTHCVFEHSPKGVRLKAESRQAVQHVGLS
jgi:hypothetical protein